jgi:flagellar biosynthesis protein FlhG
MAGQEQKYCEVWAIGGGKGGTGKTLLTSQIAVSLSLKGKRVVMIDADYGGANLHSYFNAGGITTSLKGFFNEKKNLTELISPTSIPNLFLIRGDQYDVDANKITYAQKQKFLRQIKKLDADYVLLDLAAGSDADTIDTFLIADKGILVTIPDITALDNLFQFIKTAYFRKIQQLLKREKQRITVKKIWNQKKDYNLKSVADLSNYIFQNHDPNGRIQKEIKSFNLYIVLNKLRNTNELLQGISLRSLCRKQLGLSSLYAGYVENDEKLWKNLSIIHPSKKFQVSPRIEKEIIRVTDNILADKQLNVDSLKYI